MFRPFLSFSTLCPSSFAIFLIEEERADCLPGVFRMS